MSQFEIYRSNGAPQWIADRGQQPLYQSGTWASGPSGWYSGPSIYIPWELSVDYAPQVAIKPPSNCNGMTSGTSWLWNTDQEASNAGNRGGVTLYTPTTHTPQGAIGTFYTFSTRRNLRGSNFGLQLFDGGGGLTFDAQDKPMKVIDIVECNWNPTDTNWTENRTYDGNRSYAITQMNQNTSEYFTYRSSRFDTVDRQWYHTYNGVGYCLAYRPIYGGFQFFNMPGLGTGGKESYGSSRNDYSPPHWEYNDGGQKFMIVDVTDY